MNKWTFFVFFIESRQTSDPPHPCAVQRKLFLFLFCLFWKALAPGDGAKTCPKYSHNFLVFRFYVIRYFSKACAMNFVLFRFLFSCFLCCFVAKLFQGGVTLSSSQIQNKTNKNGNQWNKRDWKWKWKINMKVNNENWTMNMKVNKNETWTRNMKMNNEHEKWNRQTKSEHEKWKWNMKN